MEKVKGRGLRGHILFPSRRESIQKTGMDICTPISGSMLPMLRIRRDSGLFVPARDRLKRYDVALYRKNGLAVMHRVIEVKSNGYIVRGDNGQEREWIGEEQIMGVMKGFYRDERYVSSENRLYRCYIHIWMVLNPLLPVCKKIKKKMYRIFRKSRRVL